MERLRMVMPDGTHCVTFTDAGESVDVTNPAGEVIPVDRGKAIEMHRWLTRWLFEQGITTDDAYQEAAMCMRAKYSQACSTIKYQAERIEKLTSKSSQRRHELVCAALTGWLGSFSAEDSPCDKTVLAEFVVEIADAVLAKELEIPPRK